MGVAGVATTLGGVSAAMAAARAGAKTLLIERNGFLGGVATAGMCCSIFNCYYTADHRLGTTGIAVYLDGSVFHTSVLPVGGNHLTRDLVAGLRCPYIVAEEAKAKYGHAIPSMVDAAEMVDLDCFG